MKMTFRWYGSNRDSITLEQIRQIPGMKGIVTSLIDIPAGEVWPLDQILKLKKEVEDAGLTLEVIESVNVHEDIKLGLPTRDQYIENYIKTLENLSKAGIGVVCYNFMPVFDWTRSDLALPLNDGSNALSYDEELVQKMNPTKMFEDIESNSNGFELPGWEKNRLQNLKDLFEQYEDVNHEKLWTNLEYFLKAIIPAAEQYDVKMAIHPDDPPWDIFGLPRIITSKENLERLLQIVDSPNNGLALCSGALGADPNNDIPEIVRHFGKMGRIHFAHVRNIAFTGEKVFHEAPHVTEQGSLNIYDIMKAYHEVGFTGAMRPDHGRMIWDEKGRPGYGLYDRALGATYLVGLWEAIDKMSRGI